MPTLIDCYNLLHQTMPPSLAGLDEARLCDLAARVGDGDTTIVCDGQPKPGLPARSSVPGVELVHSGERTADDVIVDRIGRDSAPRRLMVVTNDRAIQKAARRRRAQVVTCQRYIAELAASLSDPRGEPATDPPPTDPLDEDEVHKWMRRFGLTEDGEDTAPGHRQDLG